MGSQDFDGKNRPFVGQIVQIRRRFPCKRAIDRVLARKLERRGGQAFVPPTMDALKVVTEKLLRRQLENPLDIVDARVLSGWAKLQMLNRHVPSLVRELRF